MTLLSVLAVADPASATPLRIEPHATTILEVGASVSSALVAYGDHPPFSFDVIDGALPVGVGLETDGRLTGSPLAAGETVVDVEVTDDEGQVVAAEVTIDVAQVDLVAEEPPGSVHTAFPVGLSGDGDVALFVSEDQSLMGVDGFALVGEAGTEPPTGQHCNGPSFEL